MHYVSKLVLPIVLAGATPTSFGKGPGPGAFKREEPREASTAPITEITPTRRGLKVVVPKREDEETLDRSIDRMNEICGKIVKVSSPTERAKLEEELKNLMRKAGWQDVTDTDVVQRVAETPYFTGKLADPEVSRYVHHKIRELTRGSLTEEDKEGLFYSFAIANNTTYNLPTDIGYVDEVVNLLGGRGWLEEFMKRETHGLYAGASLEPSSYSSSALGLSYFVKLGELPPNLFDVLPDPLGTALLRELYLTAAMTLKDRHAERLNRGVRAALDYSKNFDREPVRYIPEEYGDRYPHLYDAVQHNKRFMPKLEKALTQLI